MKRLQDEQGQALVFGALTLFCLVSFAAATFDVGQVSAHRIEMQNAADQAALAGAWVEADLMSEIGWINEGMAYVYYNLMRYAVDTTVYGTLAELKEAGPPQGLPAPSDALVGVTDPVGTYDEAYGRAQEWVVRGLTWTSHLQKLEAGLAIAAPGLIRQEIFRVALAHGAQKVAIFPEDLEFYPGAGMELTLVITKTATGWNLAADNGYSASVDILGPDSYRVTSSTSGSFTIIRNSPDQYTVTDSQGHVTTLTRTPAGWLASGPDGTFTFGQGQHGGFAITHNGVTQEYRHDDNGNMQQWTNGAWSDMGGGTMTIDGTKVPVTQGAVTIGPNTKVNLEPFGVTIDNLIITLSADGSLVIAGSVGPALLRIDDTAIIVNGLSSASADNRWRRLAQRGSLQGDRSRHRMKADSASQWTYQMTTEGSVLQEETNHERFGIERAVKGYAPPSEFTGTLPAWVADPNNPAAGWFDPKIGNLSSPAAYHQTRLCWACNGTGSGSGPGGSASSATGWTTTGTARPTCASSPSTPSTATPRPSSTWRCPSPTCWPTSSSASGSTWASGGPRPGPSWASPSRPGAPSPSPAPRPASSRTTPPTTTPTASAS